jgi:hypothetical protein
MQPSINEVFAISDWEVIVNPNEDSVRFVPAISTFSESSFKYILSLMSRLKASCSLVAVLGYRHRSETVRRAVQAIDSCAPQPTNPTGIFLRG